MEAYIGSITLFAFNYAPKQYALCNGSLLSVSQNGALFSLLGTNFGGDGRTTFGIPDLRGRVPVGMGQGPGTFNRAFASMFGVDRVTLSEANLTNHNHPIGEIDSGKTVGVSSSAVVNASSAQADKVNPREGYWAKAYSGDNLTPSYTDSSDITMASDAVQVSSAADFDVNNLITGDAGASQPFFVNPPSLTLTYSICVTGLYPSRS